MFLTRFLTALVALGLFVGALLYTSQWIWALFLLPGICIASWEWAALAGYAQPARGLYAAINGLTAMGLFYFAPIQVEVWVFLLSCAFWILVAPFWLLARWNVRSALTLGIVGWIALVPMWLALVQLQEQPWALLLFLSVIWIADTFAYLSGRKFGRHKLAPQISPGKSWEGVLGAAASLGIYFVALWLIVPTGAQILPPWQALALFAALLALSIEGDLFESWMKRQAGVKDSGKLLPGHGGVLDRIDGLTSTMPAVALALYLR